MSREIKFRAWDKEEKEYYYNAEHTYDFFCSGRGCYAESFGEVLSQPDRFIVEQYTGLKDKNGKEIYEGDIVKRVEGGGFDIVGAVEWSEKAARFWVKRYYYPNGKKWEVIGNIHENPELVEDK